MDDDDKEQKIDFKEPVLKPPDAGYGWFVVLGSFLCNAIVNGICYSYGIIRLHIASSFPGASASLLSLGGSVLIGTYLLIGPVSSTLANRFGFRVVVMAGAATSTIAFASASFVTNIHAFVGLFGFLGGVGFGLIYLPAVVSVGFWFEKRRALATGIAVCGSGIGTAVFAPLTDALIDALSWRGALVVLAGLALNCALAGSLFMPPKRYHRLRQLHHNDTSQTVLQHRLLQERDVQELTTKPNGTTDQGQKPTPSIHQIIDFSLLKSYTFCLMSITALLPTLGFLQMYQFITIYAISKAVPDRQATMLVFLIGTINTFGRVASGWASDQPWADSLWINNIALIGSGIATAAIPFCSTFVPMAVCASLYGLFIAAYVTLRTVLLVELMGLHRLANAYGLLLLVQGVGITAGPPLSSAIDALNPSADFSLSFYTSGALIGMSGLLGVPLRAVSRWERARTQSISARSTIRAEGSD